MKRILVTHAGGRLGIGVSRALKASPEVIHLIGVDASPYHLQRAVTDERHLVPKARDADYLPILEALVGETGADMVWANHEAEIAVLSKAACSFKATTFLPRHSTVSLCQDKMASAERWRHAGVPTPPSMLIRSPEDLRRAFREIGSSLWLRAIHGAGGKGSLPVSDSETAHRWIEFHQGWGRFMAAKLLTQRTITWESIWCKGKLVAAQGRRRLYWEFSHLTPSGVTGIAGALEWVADPVADDIAIRAMKATDSEAHGIFSVDMTYDSNGAPNVTEINVGRFMSGGVVHWAMGEGVNFPYIAVQCAFGNRPEGERPLRNPLRQGTVLIHGMDTLPVVVPVETVTACAEELSRRRTVRQAA